MVASPYGQRRYLSLLLSGDGIAKQTYAVNNFLADQVSGSLLYIQIAGDPKEVEMKRKSKMRFI